MADSIVSALIGLVSGVLSGAFGIGGAIITTPAIALILGAPAMIAVGTPLPVILPSAVTGAVSYARHGLVDWRSGALLGIVGSVASVIGALVADGVGGSVVLIGTSLLIFWAAADTIAQLRGASAGPVPRSETAEEADAAAALLCGPNGEAHTACPADAGEKPGGAALPPAPRLTVPRGLFIGTLAGAYAGFFGLGGGFVFVPLLVRLAHFPLKRAIGTSLVAVAVLSVPSTVTHSLLGNVDWGIAVAMTLGVVPGAMVGARLSLGAGERVLRIGFALMLAVAGALLVVQQVGGV